MKRNGMRATVKQAVASAVVLSLAALGGSAMAGDVEELGLVSVCVKDENGQVRVVPDGEECGPAEKPSGWQVGGEITDVVTGPGLQATVEEGTVWIDVDPDFLGHDLIEGRGQQVRIPQSAVSPGEWIEIGRLAIPAGVWNIFGTLSVDRALVPDGGRSDPVYCRLRAGDDEALVISDPIWADDNSDPLHLQITHRAAERYDAILECREQEPEWPGSGTAADYWVSSPSIIAHGAGRLERVALTR